MFRFRMKLSSGSHSQYKLQAWFSVDEDVVQTLSVLWLHSMPCVSCVHNMHATHVILSSHNTDNVCTTSMYSH